MYFKSIGIMKYKTPKFIMKLKSIIIKILKKYKEKISKLAEIITMWPPHTVQPSL